MSHIRSGGHFGALLVVGTAASIAACTPGPCTATANCSSEGEGEGPAAEGEGEGEGEGGGEGEGEGEGEGGVPARFLIVVDPFSVGAFGIGVHGELGGKIALGGAGSEPGQPVLVTRGSKRIVYLPSTDLGPGTVTALDASVDPAANINLTFAAHTGSPFQTGASATHDVVVGNDGLTLYTFNGGVFGSVPPSITAFSLDNDGAISGTLAGSPFAIPSIGVGNGENPLQFISDPAGRFLFASTTANTLYVFATNGDGTITANPGNPFSLGFASAMLVDPTGAFLFVALGFGGVTAFTIDPIDGTPTAPGASPAGGAPDFTRELAITPDGSTLFAAGQSSGSSGGNPVPGGIGAFQVTYSPGQTPSLAPLSGSPFLGSKSYICMALDPGLQAVYAGDITDGSGGVIDEVALAATLGAFAPSDATFGEAGDDVRHMITLDTTQSSP